MRIGEFESELSTAWEDLRQGRVTDAQRRFVALHREVPQEDEPRIGLVETMKTRYRLYRLMLRLHLRRPDEILKATGAVSAFAAGFAAIAIKLCMNVARDEPRFAFAAYSLAAVICGAVILMYMSGFDATMRLWFTAEGRAVMARRELWGAVVGAVCIVAAAIWAFVFLFVQHFALIAAAVVLFLLADALDRTIRASTKRVRAVSVSYAALVGMAGLVGVLYVYSKTEGHDLKERIPPLGGILMLGALLGLWASGGVVWVLGRLFGSAGRTVDRSTQAVDRGGFKLSKQKIRKFHPPLFGVRAWLHDLSIQSERLRTSHLVQMLSDHVQFGDSRAAVVLSTDPLLIAAYSDDLDAVTVVQFERSLVDEHRLGPGTRLVTVNTFEDDGRLATDLVRGPKARGSWTNFWPMIAEFSCDDVEAIEARKRTIKDAEWQRTTELGRAFVSSGRRPRDGRPLMSIKPAAV